MARQRSTPGGGNRQGDPSFAGHWRADGAPKATYRSQQEALSIADERRQDSGADLRVYRCGYCAGWHMGTAGGRER